MSGNESFGWTINLVNSVIGVSLLSMPFCFKKCGIVLSIVLILMSALLNRFSCYLLLKSAVMAKRRNYELMAFHTFGSTGKLVVELCVLGFLLGTCIAFFVVIGDIGPSLVSQLFGLSNGPQLRAFVMTFLGMFVALPLGLLRRVDSLTSFSMLSLGLYVFLVLKMFSEAFANISDKSWSTIGEQINYWDSSHIFSSLPIFSMALSCQTQLFAIFDSSLIHSNDTNTLQRMIATVNRSVNICSAIYISVGISGYIAFCGQPFGGNILIVLPNGFISTFTLIAFVFTVLISFPLCLFPCRTSLHSLLSRKGTTTLLSTSSPSIHMTDRHFRLLTVSLIVSTIGISILLPHIELVLGILGSTIGAIICFIIPALMFLALTSKPTTERLFAQIVVIIGVFILIICTFSTLHEIYFIQNTNIISKIESSKTLALNEKQFQNNFEKTIKDKEAKAPKAAIRTHQLPNELRVPLPSMDASKVKRQEELLQRLEKQQLEHKRLLEEQKELFDQMKKHNQMYHKLVVEPNSPNSPNSPSNHNNSNHFLKTDTNKHSIDSKQQNLIYNNNNNNNNLAKKVETIVDKPLVDLSKTDNNLTKDTIVVKSKPSDHSEDKNILKEDSLRVNPPKIVEQNMIPKNSIEMKNKLVVDQKLSANEVKLTNVTNISNGNQNENAIKINALS